MSNSLELQEQGGGAPRRRSAGRAARDGVDDVLERIADARTSGSAAARARFPRPRPLSGIGGRRLAAVRRINVSRCRSSRASIACAIFA
jgi:hypothetical protein